MILRFLRWKKNSKVGSFFYFRIDKDTEVRGLDIKKHGEPAYPTAAYGHGWDNEGDLDMKSKFIIIWYFIFLDRDPEFQFSEIIKYLASNQVKDTYQSHR